MVLSLLNATSARGVHIKCTFWRSKCVKQWCSFDKLSVEVSKAQRNVIVHGFLWMGRDRTACTIFTCLLKTMRLKIYLELTSNSHFSAATVSSDVCIAKLSSCAGGVLLPNINT